MECQFSLEKVKGQGHRTSKTSKQLPRIWRTCLLPIGESSASDSSADCKLSLTIVRPNLLSTPETLGNWTDGRISCRHTAPLSSCFKFSSWFFFQRDSMLCYHSLHNDIATLSFIKLFVKTKLELKCE